MTITDEWEKLQSGCAPLDDLIGGGFEHGIITEVYGEAGSGKTNLAIQLAIACAKQGKKTIFIDTEGFSPERFRQLAGKDAGELAKTIIIYEPTDFQSQYTAICDCEKIMDQEIALIILDSPVIFYRQMVSEEESIVFRRQLASQLSTLHTLTRRYKVVALITNQVYTDVETDHLKPLGGNPLEHIPKTILQFEKIGPQRRRATLKKHRFRPEGISCEFLITHEGLR